MSILSAIAAIGQLFGGYSVVTLGPVQLQGIEIPERIPLGGEQAINVIKLPGGQRVVQVMGRDDKDLTWSGYLEGPSAESRMNLLDSLRQSGQQIQLTFGQQSFSVVVKSFDPSYERTNWIPYTITCLVVQDNSAQFGAGPPSLLDSLNDDLNSALGFNVSATVSSALSTAQTVVNVAGALGLKSSAWQGATQAILGAQTAIGAEQALATGSITGVVTAAAVAGNVLGAPSAAGAAIALTNMANASAQLANSTAAAGYTGRASANLAGASA